MAQPLIKIPSATTVPLAISSEEIPKARELGLSPDPCPGRQRGGRAGPALAGLVIRLASGGDTSSHEGVGIVFFVVAALYAVSVVMTVLMDYQGKPHQESKSPIKDTIEAFEFLKQEKLLLGLLVLGFVPLTFGFSVTFLAPVFNQEALAGNASTLSLLLSATGIGALVGVEIIVVMCSAGIDVEFAVSVSYAVDVLVNV